jgi:thiamine-phosphate pyrophosphorylase
MADRPLLYYITDRTAFAADEPTRRRRLLETIAEAVHAGVDYIQLREKDLPTRELESLAGEVMSVIFQLRTENRELRTSLLINSRTDVALAVGADGVHLRSDDISPHEVKEIWRRCGADMPRAAAGVPRRDPLIGVSCHSPQEVSSAAAAGASFAVFAPVFEKKAFGQKAAEKKPDGLAALHEACRASIPVLALGGVTLTNIRSCLEAGASGIAAIRLFQENEIERVVLAQEL